MMEMKEVVEMKKVLKKYGGIIFFYATIVIMVWAVSCRLEYLTQEAENQETYLAQVTK